MAKKAITLSVVFPLLDAEEDIKDLFDYTARQINIDTACVEVIAVNDGSTDSTLKEIENHKHLFDNFANFRIITHNNRQGLAKTRLNGAREATGKYLTFLDKKSRPDPDYIDSFLKKKRNIVIGSPYSKKDRGPWVRVLTLIRKKLYYPYYDMPFPDISLDAAAYKKFKNKGGGGAMLVLRKYFLEVAEHQRTGKDVNDDSMLIEQLATIEPILKTYSARSEYFARAGNLENVVHLYNRGPKFVDYYIKPGTRFFPLIVSLGVFLVINAAVLVWQPLLIAYELIFLLVILICVGLYLAEDSTDFFAFLFVLPMALVSFCLGICKGLAMKLFRLY